MVKYYFAIDYASAYGVDEAIMLENFIWWLRRNKASNINQYDGHYWTFNTRKAYTLLFPFWTERQIYRIIQSLVKQGVLVQGNYNKFKYDRTAWYAVRDETLLEVIGEPDCTKSYNESDQTVQPIPDITTDVN